MEPTKNPSTLMIGPAYSGKSDYAPKLLKPELKTLVIGTSLPLDEQMKERIRSLKQNRPSHWEQIDLKRGLMDHLEGAISIYPQVLVDSFSQYLAQEILSCLEAHSTEQVRAIVDAELKRLLKFLTDPSRSLVIISSEVGAGPSPTGEVARLYRELLGRSHCRMAAAASRVIRLDAGIPQTIKSTL